MGDVNVALNAFGFNLIQKLQKDAEKGKSKSCVISPFSLGMAIAAAAEGADKDTLQGILKALNLEELNLRDFDILRKDLEKGNEKYLTVANGLFYDREFGILKSYIEDVEDYLNVHVEELSKDRAAEKVNSWVAKATKDKITRIIDDASKSRLLLVNAIHFKADWENPFDERNTQSGTFTRSDGSSFKCQMMHQTGEFQYQESDDFQAVSMLYRNKFRAVVVLPRKDSSSSTVLEHISKDWKNFPKDFKSSDGKLSLPRFQVEWKSELNNALSDLGMSAAFDQMAADFSKACDVKGLYISAVLHKTYLDVNERGTEAAAASAVDERSRSLSPPRGFTMNVDHTFIFILWDKTTDQILFTGVIDDFSESPSKSENNGNSRGRKRSPSPSPEKRRRSPSPRRRSPSPRRSPSHGGRPPRFGSESDRSNSTCLFVGNLPVYYREGEVRDMFEKFGKIRSLMLSMNKERVAYAFVEFDSRSDAEDALKWADGHVVDKDYKLRVDWDVGRDKKRSNRPYRRGGFRGRSSYRGYGRRRDSRSPRRSYSRSRSRSPRRKRSRSPRRYSRSPRRRSPSRSRSPSPKRR